MGLREWIPGDYAKRFNELESKLQTLEAEVKDLAKEY